MDGSMDESMDGVGGWVGGSVEAWVGGWVWVGEERESVDERGVLSRTLFHSCPPRVPSFPSLLARACARAVEKNTAVLGRREAKLSGAVVPRSPALRGDKAPIAPQTLTGHPTSP